MKTNQPDVFDVEILAEKTVEKLRVGAEHAIWIWAIDHSMELIEALALKIQGEGAFWERKLNSKPLLRIPGFCDSQANGLVRQTDQEREWCV
jgi:hypothetical protein